MDDPDLTRLFDLVKAAWRQRPESRDWIDEYLSGEILLTDEAARIAGVSSETIRRRCEAAAATNRPLGILLAGSVWLVSLARLLDQIELREGKHSRLIAESRAKKYAEMRSSPQQSLRRVGTATS
jgi:hypothetical protein